jgi:hypothetical protein
MKTLLLVVAVLLSACGGNYKDETKGTESRFGNQLISVINGNLNTENSTLSGTGAVLFQEELGSVKSGHSYALDFSLNDGGALTLVSHSDSELAGGFEIEMRRIGNSLKVLLKAQGQERDTIAQNGTDVFAGIDASGVIRLQFDLHNNETPTHLLAWNRANGELFTEATAFLNTEDEVDLSNGSPGIGTGSRFGLKLASAIVTRAERSSPKYSE